MSFIIPHNSPIHIFFCHHQHHSLLLLNFFSQIFLDSLYFKLRYQYLYSKNINIMKVKMGCDEKWKKDAMMDDTVVAELLLQLNNAPPPPPKQALSAKWKVSQRRSKSLTRVSPTTPLSWSGGASFSGGGGGVAVDFLSEESSQPQPILKKLQSSRSKVTSEATTTGKRPRKKKTLAELKAAEIALEEERKQLIVEVKRVRANLDRERSSNEKLKRLKLELESQTAKGEGGFSSSSEVAVTSTPTQKLAPSAPLATTIPRMGSIDVSPKQRSPFEIPDLNLPVEDGCAEAHNR
ncbi:hypothetical protein Leryth_005174 [Lithospermum erythrorhizon]|nr:hypothetical protein Leryth_005174 [Lithospermum erythrorhizon]